MAGYHCWVVRVVRWYPLWVSEKHTIRSTRCGNVLTVLSVQLRYRDHRWCARDGLLERNHELPRQRSRGFDRLDSLRRYLRRCSLCWIRL